MPLLMILNSNLVFRYYHFNGFNLFIYVFDPTLAINVYRHLGDISMVWSLEEIMDVEDIQLLSGHLHMILGRVSKAQVIFKIFVF